MEWQKTAIIRPLFGTLTPGPGSRERIAPSVGFTRRAETSSASSVKPTTSSKVMDRSPATLPGSSKWPLASLPEMVRGTWVWANALGTRTNADSAKIVVSRRRTGAPLVRTDMLVPLGDDVKGGAPPV